MFGRNKSNPSDELYLDQKSRNDSYGQTYEYRTIHAFGTDDFDIELNAQAKAGWELVTCNILSDSTMSFYATLRRPRHP